MPSPSRPTLPISPVPMQCAPPRLETQRLILRAYQRSDLEPLLAMSAHPSFFRFSGGEPKTPEQAWAHLLRHLGHWTLVGHGVFALEDKASGRFVGEVGLCDFSRCLGPCFDALPEATWSIAPEFQGRGLATEAARAALIDLESRQASSRSVCLIHEQNHASLRVADKLGFRPFATRIYRDYPAVLLERSR